MNLPQPEHIHCDVLCIGGSGAAVSAAYMAGKNGSNVVLVSKGKAGRSGNAIMVGGGFGIDGYSTHNVVGEQTADDTYTPDMLMQRVIKAGFYLGDQMMARQFVTDAAPMLKTFIDWSRQAGQKFEFVKSGLYAVSGSSTGKTIAQGIKACENCQVYHDVSIFDLLLEDGRVCGAVGMDVYTGQYIAFHAKSVILATGGWQPHSLHNTISDMTGDGMAMAMRAGAQIADMEFLLYIPTAVTPSWLKGSILPYLFTIPIFMPLAYQVVDGAGKQLDIPEPFNSVPGSNKMKKLIYSYFWSTGTDMDTMNGNLFYDYSNQSVGEIYRCFEHFIQHYSKWHKKGFYNGTDLIMLRDNILQSRRFAFGFGNEYSNGGIVVNERMETGLPGLYAAGEVTSGLFGAFRAGDGLSEMLAHGYRAGIEASKFAANEHIIPDANKFLTEQIALVERVKQNPATGERPTNLAAQLRQCADMGMGIVRDGESTQKALYEVRQITSDIEYAYLACAGNAYNLNLFEWLQTRNLAILTQAALSAVQQRKESRGTHVRKDYPAVDNKNYLHRITVRLNDGRLETGKLPVKSDELPLPEQNYASVPDYIATII